MKAFLSLLVATVLGGGVLSSVRASAAPIELTAAVQAVRQSPDPSAAVAAFASGMAVDRNSPALFEAYVGRMIDFGLPELAYRQAWSLTSLVSTNGLAWGVLAYVDARRGDMTNAVAALNLAAEFAPGHPFVQRTAGELLAWYDLRPEGAQLPVAAQARLDKTRNLLHNRLSFMTAYAAAKKAYQAGPGSQWHPAQSPGPSGGPPVIQTNAPDAYATPEPLAPPVADGLAPYPPPLGTEPVWVDADPDWWWEPVGFFAGAYFVAYPYCVFDHHHSSHHHAYWREHGVWHGGNPSWPHPGPHDRQGATGEWRQPGQDHRAYFGLPAQPSPSVARVGPAAPNRGEFEPNRSPTVETRLRRLPPEARAENAIPSQASRMPSWSSFENLNRGPSYKAGIGTLPNHAAAPSSRSWSTLGESLNSRSVSPAPTIGSPAPVLSTPPRPGTAPSLSGLGRGAPASTGGSGTVRSSPAPTKGGATSERH